MTGDAGTVAAAEALTAAVAATVAATADASVAERVRVAGELADDLMQEIEGRPPEPTAEEPAARDVIPTFILRPTITVNLPPAPPETARRRRVERDATGQIVAIVDEP